MCKTVLSARDRDRSSKQDITHAQDPVHRVSGLLLLFTYLFNFAIMSNGIIYQVLNPFYVYIASPIALVAILLIVLRRKELDRQNTILCVAMIISGGVAVSINQLPIGDYFSLVWFVVLFLLVSIMPLDERQYRIANIVSLLSLLYLVVYSVVFHDSFLYMAEHGASEISAVVNPNGVAVSLVFTFWLFIITSRGLRNRFAILVSLAVLLGLISCDARFATFAFVVSLVVSFFLYKRSKVTRRSVTVLLSAFVVGGIVVVPLLLAGVQLLDNGFMLFGKPIATGRERIWASFIQYFIDNPQTILFGTGHVNGLYWHNEFNPHNAYLALISEYGICTLVLYLALAFSVIREFSKRFPSNKIPICAVAALFCAIVLIGYTEAGINYNKYVFYYAFVMGTMTAFPKTAIKESD